MKRLLTIVLGAGLIATSASASSPGAWEKYQQEVTTSCVRASGLRNAKTVGAIIRFGDEVGYDALMVTGNYPQPHMKNQTGQFLCLFNKRTRKAYTSEATQSMTPSTTLNPGSF